MNQQRIEKIRTLIEIYSLSYDTITFYTQHKSGTYNWLWGDMTMNYSFHLERLSELCHSKNDDIYLWFYNAQDIKVDCDKHNPVNQKYGGIVIMV